LTATPMGKLTIASANGRRARSSLPWRRK
jgi:hypothetical protein